MNYYVLYINDNTYVSHINWIGFEIPEIKTDKFENALLLTDQYLDYTVINDGTNSFKGKSRKDLLLRYFPHLKVRRVKIVIDE